MSSEAMDSRKRPTSAPDGRPPKKFKTSDLPLSTATRSAIDGLVLTAKKKGNFDRLRKEVWAKFLEGEAKASFTAALTSLAESEIERDPSLLSRDRGKAATLIEGAVDRTDIYKTVEVAVDALIEEHIGQVEAALREIRELAVGPEAAGQERASGSKTEEHYAREADERRRARERIKEEEVAKQREQEREAMRVREMERAKRQEEERQREMERAEKRRVEYEKEREREWERDRQREEERERDREREREREREEERARSREQERERDGRKRRRDHDEDDNEKEAKRPRPPPGEKTPMTPPPLSWASRAVFQGYDDRKKASNLTPLPPEEDKALDEEALNLLLKESQELAAKNSRTSWARGDRERSDSPDPFPPPPPPPPPRRSGPQPSSKGGHAVLLSSPRDSPKPHRIGLGEKKSPSSSSRRETTAALGSSSALSVRDAIGQPEHEAAAMIDARTALEAAPCLPCAGLVTTVRIRIHTWTSVIVAFGIMIEAAAVISSKATHVLSSLADITAHQGTNTTTMTSKTITIIPILIRIRILSARNDAAVDIALVLARYPRHTPPATAYHLLLLLLLLLLVARPGLVDIHARLHAHAPEALHPPLPPPPPTTTAKRVQIVPAVQLQLQPQQRRGRAVEPSQSGSAIVNNSKNNNLITIILIIIIEGESRRRRRSNVQATDHDDPSPRSQATSDKI
ncbi:MAG: hypothetical protein M1826_004710 [Phylliscum demangeonii]|nr:MAG: hypothetical protein M1826_004710 [Phylliscum demangeonii]